MAGDHSGVNPVPQDPAFISYLFTLNHYDCHFVVGNETQIEPERIGVVKHMLMAHSEVFRSDMLEVDIENNRCIPVNDMYPDTFRNLLRYVYGWDNIDSLGFEEADNLLYAAEKYMIKSLKTRLAQRLIDLLDANNVCILLNNPACYSTLELNSVITRILQYETDGVLASPHFLNLRCDAVARFFEQEAMNVDELAVWRAAIKWAKYQTNSEKGQDLRSALEGPAKHLRVCAVDDFNFYNEVYPAGVLTDKEAIMVSSSKALKKIQHELISFSNKLSFRSKTSICCEVRFEKFQERFMGRDVEFLIMTKKYAIELFPLNCQGEHFESCEFEMNQKHLKCDCIYECTTTVTRITDCNKNSSDDPPESFQVYTQVGYGGEITVPLAKEGKNIVLLPNSKYRILVKFNEVVTMYESIFDNNYDNEHISVIINYPDRFNYFAVPFKSLFYRPVKCYTFQHIHCSCNDLRVLLA